MEERMSSAAEVRWASAAFAHLTRDVVRPRWLSAALARASAEVRRRPVLVIRGVSVGWAVLLGFLGIFGPLCNTAAYWATGWTRADGYGTGDWSPFYVAAVVLSCGGFVLSGYAVARLHRPVVAAAILTFAASVLLAIAISVVAVISKPTPVNHTWFFVIWTALPFASYAGFVLNPTLVLGGAWLALRSR
jgi:hypothetical protein